MLSELELKTRSMEKILSIDFIRRPKSSRIYSFGYDQDLQRLYVLFQNGNIYMYYHVLKTSYNEMVNAESVGKKFQEVIIQLHYGYRRMYLTKLADV